MKNNLSSWGESMNINYEMIAIVMLFVVLISINITLNKILVILKDIKKRIYIDNSRMDNTRDFFNRDQN